MRMRIDAGAFKGRKLLDSKYSHIRPTTDKVRDAIFVKLQFFVAGKSVLDLFSGTGALGIEAFSRGAAFVQFVDKDARSIALTKANLNAVGALPNLKAARPPCKNQHDVDFGEQAKTDAGKIKVDKCDALTFLDKCSQQFDLILVDPPYASGLYEKVLQKIADNHLLLDGGIVVCEHSTADKITSPNFSVLDEKKYGDITVTYFQNA